MATLTTISLPARQGETFIRIDSEYVNPLSGPCTISGNTYTYKTAGPYALLVVPTNGRVGLLTDAGGTITTP